MRKNIIRNIICFCMAALCSLSFTMGAWAEEYDPGTDSKSRVIDAATGNIISQWQEDEVISGQNDQTSVSLGMFTTTGYCGCSKCCSGLNLTYAGTIPRAGHTISADLSIYPIGTKLMIDGVTYTVEDMGSNVNGNHIDIFYDSHEEALGHGKKTQEVFSVVE